ncbi:host attachment family protein [Paracoccus sp. 1_MG-2023]|uniref:host attachment family protein n=1 Tax=unclassified Paracoccus (in: a-proteobacteria) TaxID=2688777 RepID=UPI001C08E173|nr:MULTISPECIES: host attachment family protein [unclassified Paracoccus (in: a-proteobacteria)]MBU2957750.1 host attachment family protein [Paracoccus sp. C2R09]MDO6667402.1 host attachment family protein [Paracoccus sp. 1_MG-2023]
MSVEKLTNKTWVLVADGEKALFLVNHGDQDLLDLRVFDSEKQDNPSDYEQSANRPGRQHQSVGSGRSAYEDTDWHQLAKERFADHLAELLYERAHKGQFDRIVLVAAPKVLAELREQLHKEVSDKVVGEVPKTLTNHPLDQIEKVLKSELV